MAENEHMNPSLGSDPIMFQKNVVSADVKSRLI
jgi:hypothetical protein